MNMYPTSTLSAAQQQVLDLITAGASMTAAARDAGVHRNTIYNWLRSSAFRDAMEQARYDNAMYWHEQAAALAETALNTLVEILDTSEAPPAVRARIALAILDRAATPPPPPFLKGSLLTAEPAPPEEPEEPEVPALPEDPIESFAPQIVPKSAQMPIRNPCQTGRNELCPCGSGVKFKHCCLGKMRNDG